MSHSGLRNCWKAESKRTNYRRDCHTEMEAAAHITCVQESVDPEYKELIITQELNPASWGRPESPAETVPEGVLLDIDFDHKVLIDEMFLPSIQDEMWFVKGGITQRICHYSRNEKGKFIFEYESLGQAIFNAIRGWSKLPPVKVYHRNHLKNDCRESNLWMGTNRLGNLKFMEKDTKLARSQELCRRTSNLLDGRPEDWKVGDVSGPDLQEGPEASEWLRIRAGAGAAPLPSRPPQCSMKNQEGEPCPGPPFVRVTVDGERLVLCGACLPNAILGVYGMPRMDDIEVIAPVVGEKTSTTKTNE